MKEMEETEYWLILCKNVPSYPYNEILMQKLLDIKRIATKIVVSSRQTTSMNPTDIH